MITEIGIIAGDIWHYLDQHGDVTLSKLASGIDKNRENVLMSLGWLAREGHVVVQQTEGDYKINLRKDA
ncbi:MAG: winged helix-turn-helix domain-containing protein [Candidatus Omnitrophota bacterium]|nr:winged helix-turn-helix domain-containing protein [Candidatus Omnitrophota bacterium]MBU1928557.1 winged helix-turn-helix domain-containing protein [Candidatus Omnitrophota bacterium]MBU2034917.1 winged helix-turn-helix domain-containing protein [Candidatus Omnitrophota bacterium]MBU2222353.1 winged helix-turn-helix domain-containing protein [Candidatus Omnitrophota bacterium]